MSDSNKTSHQNARIIDHASSVSRARAWRARLWQAMSAWLAGLALRYPWLAGARLLGRRLIFGAAAIILLLGVVQIFYADSLPQWARLGAPAPPDNAAPAPPDNAAPAPDNSAAEEARAALAAERVAHQATRDKLAAAIAFAERMRAEGAARHIDNGQTPPIYNMPSESDAESDALRRAYLALALVQGAPFADWVEAAVGVVADDELAFLRRHAAVGVPSLAEVQRRFAMSVWDSAAAQTTNAPPPILAWLERMSARAGVNDAVRVRRATPELDAEGRALAAALMRAEADELRALAVGDDAPWRVALRLYLRGQAIAATLRAG